MALLDGARSDQGLYRRYDVAPRRHAALLLPMIEEVLLEADTELKDLDGLAFGQGPGSFTGVRIASSVIQALAFAVDLPVVGISNLAALAQASYRQQQNTQVLAAIDARMQEVYWGAYVYDGQSMRLQSEERVSPADEVDVARDEAWFGAGTGWGAYAEALKHRVPNLTGTTPEALPDAQDVASLAMIELLSGRAVPAEQAQPVYLRNNVAKKSRKSVL